MDLSNNIFIIGKHKGNTFEFVRKNDISYCNWALKLVPPLGRDMLQFQKYLKNYTRKVTCDCCNGSGLSDIM